MAKSISSRKECAHETVLKQTPATRASQNRNAHQETLKATATICQSLASRWCSVRVRARHRDQDILSCMHPDFRTNEKGLSINQHWRQTLVVLRICCVTDHPPGSKTKNCSPSHGKGDGSVRVQKGNIHGQLLRQTQLDQTTLVKSQQDTWPSSTKRWENKPSNLSGKPHYSLGNLTPATLQKESNYGGATEVNKTANDHSFILGPVTVSV